MSSSHLFALGHQPKISTAEIKAVFALFKVKFDILKINNNYLILECEKKINCTELMARLGGTIKIGEKINTTVDEFLLKNHIEGKIEYSISGSNAKKLSLEIKKLLKSSGKSVRYIEANNTATILHNKLVEKQGDFTIIDNDIFVTRAIQPIEEFGERDYGRPATDGKSGMIPPKLARMMINLSEAKAEDTILDPFCGSGTILAEAMSMDFTNLIGADISNNAIEDTKKNLQWLSNTNNIQYSIFNIKYYNIDARKIENIIKPNSVNKIVTEPFLGKPLNGRETKQQLENQADELAELYTDSFASFAKILKPNSTVIFIIPTFRFKDEWIRVNCVAKIKDLGFEPQSFGEDEFLLYWREKQHVGREIWRFRLT